MVELRTLMILLLILSNIPSAETRFRRYKWGVNYEYKSPDRYKNSSLTENVAIHRHGIRQPRTYLYNGHYGESEPFAYDNDWSIILHDWSNKSTYEQVTDLSSILFGSVGEPQGHNIAVVATDGHYVEPFVVKNLFIYSGVTNSVLIKTDKDPSRNYWASSTVVSRDRTTSNGLAIFNYYPNHPRKSLPTVPPPSPSWNDSAPRVAQSFAIKARQGYIYPPPQTSDRVIVLLNTQNMFNGCYWWSINIVLLIALKEDLDGLGKFDMVNVPKKYNLVDPIMKNTVPVHPYGWTASWFWANNPGVWAFHCHIESHFYMGMGVVFEEGIEKVGKLPTSIMGCGDIEGFHRP